MKNTFVKLIGTIGIILAPKTTSLNSDYTGELQKHNTDKIEFVQELRLTNARHHLKMLEEDIRMEKETAQFLKNRLDSGNYSTDKKRNYQFKLNESYKDIKSLKQQRDSVYLFIRKNS